MSRVLITYTAIGLVVFSILGIGLWLFYPSNKNPYPSIGISSKEKLDYQVKNQEDEQDFTKTVIDVNSSDANNEQKAITPINESLGANLVVNQNSIIADGNSPNTSKEETKEQANTDNNKTDSTKVFTNLKKADFQDLPKPGLSKIKNPVENISAQSQNKIIKKEEQVLSTDETKKLNYKPNAEYRAPELVYWIQAASMENKENIDRLKDLLDKNMNAKGVIFKITGKDQKIYYRLRYGPYTDKSDVSVANEKIKTTAKLETVIFENKV